MADHVDALELAEYQEGLLSTRRRAAIGTHLAGCPRCAEVERQLRSVSATLAAAPDPEFPAAVAARLQAALAAEAGRARPTAELTSAPSTGREIAGGSRAGRSADGADPQGRSGPPPAPEAGRPGHRRPARPARRSWSRFPGRAGLRLAGAGAAVALLGGGGYAISQLLSAGSTASQGTGSLPSANSSAKGAAPAHGAPIEGPMRGVYPVVASGVDYRPGTLRAQVSATLARYLPPGRRAAPLPASGNSPSARFSGAADLAGCVNSVTRGLQPDLVDVARYAGRPAIVIAARSGSGQAVWVIGTNCSATGAEVYARLKLTGQG